MKRTLAVVVVLAMVLGPIPSTVYAQGACNTGASSAFANETITVSTSALPLTAATYNPTGGPRATVALISVNTNNVRVWFDGTAPTTSAGIVLAAGQTVTVCGAQIPRFQAIRDDASDAELAVEYFQPAF